METKSFETLKQAGRIVADLIRKRTPPVFETCRKAYADLGELVSYASRALDEEEGVPPAFAAGVHEVVTKLEAFRARHAKPTGTETKMSIEQFAEYFQGQVQKALTEDAGPALRRLHALEAGINKAVLGYTSEAGIPIVEFTDPWQQASVEREGTGAAVVTSGTANQGEVKATPGISVDQIFKATADAVEKAERESLEFKYGWSNDLASTEFLRGERRIDFGPDGSK